MNDHEHENDVRGEDDKLEFRGVRTGAAGERFENFWFYNKWKVIIGLFLAIILGISIFQMIEKDTPDIYVMYAGPEYFSAGDVTRIREAFRSIIDDYNGDGERGMSLLTVTCLTNEQMDALREEAVSEGEVLVVNKQENQQNIQRFNMEMFSGESVICLLDPALYEQVREAGGFIPMDELFREDELSDIRLYDSCGVYFNSLKFAEYFSVMGDMPDDTILCIRRISTMSIFKGQKKYERLHEYHVDAFRKMILFEYPEGYVPATEQIDSH